MATDAITVTKGAACTSAASCLDGQQCENGRCFWEQPSGEIRALFAYDADLFEPATISQFARHYQRVLQGVLDSPTQRVSSLRLLTDEEESELMIADFPPPTTVGTAAE